ncbi:hypothetical protein J6590_038595 [Homalodisca vitripennis]|nr:hypothetical protein J6590_038595 [Homalodisca vitripennis]
MLLQKRIIQYTHLLDPPSNRSLHNRSLFLPYHSEKAISVYCIVESAFKMMFASLNIPDLEQSPHKVALPRSGTLLTTNVELLGLKGLVDRSSLPRRVFVGLKLEVIAPHPLYLEEAVKELASPSSKKAALPPNLGHTESPVTPEVGPFRTICNDSLEALWAQLDKSTDQTSQDHFRCFRTSDLQTGCGCLRVMAETETLNDQLSLTGVGLIKMAPDSRSQVCDKLVNKSKKLCWLAGITVTVTAKEPAHLTSLIVQDHVTQKPRVTRCPLHGITVTVTATETRPQHHAYCARSRYTTAPGHEMSTTRYHCHCHGHRTRPPHLADCARSRYTTAPDYEMYTTRYHCHCHGHRTRLPHLTDCARSRYTTAPGHEMSTTRYLRDYGIQFKESQFLQRPPHSAPSCAAEFAQLLSAQGHTA